MHNCGGICLKKHDGMPIGDIDDGLRIGSQPSFANMQIYPRIPLESVPKDFVYRVAQAMGKREERQLMEIFRSYDRENRQKNSFFINLSR